MLEHLRQRVIQTLADVRTATLSTCGPAGLQSSHLPCEASGIELYILAPRTSDHLFNIESQPEVAVVNEIWSLKGRACVVERAVCPSDLAQRPEAEWSQVVQIRPTRLTLLCIETGIPAETIDVE